MIGDSYNRFRAPFTSALEVQSWNKQTGRLFQLRLPGSHPVLSAVPVCVS